MKSLLDYINESKFNHNCRCFDEFITKNNISIITEDICDLYFKRHWNNKYSKYKHSEFDITRTEWINEMLKSHDIGIILRKLNLEFSDKFGHIILKQQEKTKSKIKGSTLYIPKELRYDVSNWNRLLDILDKYMWFITDKYVDENHKQCIDIEPIESENCTEFIKNECKGIVFHVTHKQNRVGILKFGLKLYGENRDSSSFRYYKNRSFFVCGKTIRDIRTGIQRIMADKGWSLNEIAVFSTNINKLNINFYRDPSDYDDINAIYTYAYFPPKLLKEVKFDEITT